MGQIDYGKLWGLMKAKSVSTYRLLKDGVVSPVTLQSLRNNRNVNTSTIAVLCKALDCQPGDILEYVE
jgi:DNA-binding Xre family transcriptional regulator